MSIKDFLKKIENLRFTFAGKQFTFDWGGIFSLAATIVAIGVISDGFRSILKIFDDIADPLQIAIVLVLILVGSTSLWLTVRVIGLYVIRRYILMESGEKAKKWIYMERDIFQMVSYVLTANLCFTLMRALALTAGSKQSAGGEQTSGVIAGLINVAIQAVIIGFLTLLPRYKDFQFLNKVGGPRGYVSIVISMIVSIVALVLVREFASF